MRVKADPGHLVGDLIGDVVHHRPDRRPARRCDETDKKVTLVTLDQIAAEAGPGATGIGVNIWVRCEDRLDLRQLAIGLSERGAGGTPVVEHKATLIHAREKPCPDPRISEVTGAA